MAVNLTLYKLERHMSLVDQTLKTHKSKFNNLLQKTKTEKYLLEELWKNS